MSAWEDEKFYNSNQKDLTFAFLNKPPKENVKHVAFFVAGYQQSPGTAQTITGQNSNWRDSIDAAFGSNNWKQHPITFDRRSAAYNFIKGDSQPYSYYEDMRPLGEFALSNTLVINVVDASFAQPGLAAVTGAAGNTQGQNENNLQGWYSYLDNHLNWSNIKLYYGHGMSRGGCWVISFAKYIVQQNPNNFKANGKIILETTDAVCDPDELGQLRNDVVNPLVPGTGSLDWYQCHKIDWSKVFNGYNLNNMRWKNTIGGQRVLIDAARAVCDPHTDQNVHLARKLLAPSSIGITGQYGELVTSNSLIPTNTDVYWYQQQWVDSAHCAIGRYWGHANPQTLVPVAGASNCGLPGYAACSPGSPSYDLVYHHLKHGLAATKSLDLHPSSCVSFTAWTACTPVAVSSTNKWACGGTRSRTCTRLNGSVFTDVESCTLSDTVHQNFNSLCFLGDWSAPYTVPAATYINPSTYNCQYSDGSPDSVSQKRLDQANHYARSSGVYSVFGSNSLWSNVATAGTLASISTTTKAVTGTSTLFLTQVKVGQWIATPTQVLGYVASISSNTLLYLRDVPPAVAVSGLKFKVLERTGDSAHVKQVPYCTWRTTGTLSDTTACPQCTVCDAVPQASASVIGAELDAPASFFQFRDNIYSGDFIDDYTYKTAAGTANYDLTAFNPSSLTYIKFNSTVASTFARTVNALYTYNQYLTKFDSATLVPSSSTTKLLDTNAAAELQALATSTGAVSGGSSVPGNYPQYNPNCYNVLHPSQDPGANGATVRGANGKLYRCTNNTPSRTTFESTCNCASGSTCVA